MALVRAVTQSLTSYEPPTLLAVDGRSGAGKSTCAAFLAESLDAVLIPSDDFFAAGVTAAEWEARSPEERARDAIEWRRLRRDVLEPLLEGSPAHWYAFDFARGPRPDGSYAMSRHVSKVDPKPVIILDGAYAARPELSDLISLSILVETPEDVRRARLTAREDPVFLAEWHERWGAAEAHYFGEVRPPSAFDIIVTNG